MLKRSATSDLNHTNWNEEEEPEKPSGFKLASAEVMSKRVIKTGKRRGTERKLAEASAPGAVAASPFSKFSFTGASSQPPSNPLPTTGFNIMSSVKSPVNSPATNGPAETKKNDSKDKPDDKQTTYLAKLKGLNEELLSWIESHFKKNPTSIFTPVFEDYNKYLKEIQAERDTKSSASAPPAGAPLFSGFKFSADPGSKTTPGPGSLGSAGSSTPTISSPSSDKPKAPVGNSLFGNAAATSSKADPPLGSIFGNAATKPDTASKADPPLGSIFGNAATKPDAPFSFGGAKPFSFGNVTNPLSSGRSVTETASEVQNDEDSEEPPKNEFKPVTEDDAVFSQRVKVFVKKDADYADRGVGTLYIKAANNKFQALVRADTSLGNLLLNIILTESMPVKRMGKNNIMLVCVPLPGTDAKPLPTLLKVKTKEEADKLFDELNKYKK